MFSRKSSSHLYDRISAALTPQFKKCVDGREYDRLIIFAGNGLTRIAASGQKDDVSWTGWINVCLKDVKSDLRLEYLSALGYSLDQAFSFALDLAIEKGTPHPVALWRHLWNATQSLKPSPVHEALVQAADVIMTTNYDRLFEQTAAGSKKPQSLDMFAESAPRIARDRLTKLLIFKLHGSFPEREEDFNDWCKAGPRAAAYTEAYEDLAIQQSATQFENRFAEVISELAGPLQGKATTVLFLGTGLGAEELILTRLLLAARAKSREEQRKAIWLALETSEPLDPLHKFRRRGIQTIKLPLGLVASSETRALGALALLDLAVANSRRGDAEKARLASVISASKAQLPESAAGVHLSTSSPRIVSIGQSAVNRVAGFEQSISEEKAYGAKKASWSPIDPTNRLLSTTEVGGQALVPCLVWDTLGIPCSFMSHVWDDDRGRMVLRALQGTKWVDFSGVTQVSNSPAKAPAEVMSTENSTVATWFGIRTILDLFPQTPLHCSVEPLSYDAPLLYVTKRGWETVRNTLRGRDDGYDPLIVFETGGKGGGGLC